MSSTSVRYIPVPQHCSPDTTQPCSTACPCPPLQSRDWTTLRPPHPGPEGEELVAGSHHSLFSACQQCPLQQGVRIHRAPQSRAAAGPGGTKEIGNSSKNLEGGYLLGLPLSRATGSVTERRHTSHCPSFPQNA